MSGMKWFTTALMALSIGCSSGSEEFPPEQSVSAQQLLQDCVSTDLNDLAGLYNTLLNLVGNSEGAPAPEFNLLAGILAGGVIPWTLDLDQDGVADLGGTVFFLDALGNVTIPVDLSAILAGGGLEDIQSILAGIPDGTSLNITYDYNGLLTQSNSYATTSGAFAISFNDGSFGSATGNSVVRSGDCTFEFDFTDIGPDDFLGGVFPAVEGGFDLLAGSDRMLGTLVFDGTDIAEFRGRFNNGPLQTIRFDLKTGSTLP